MLYVGRDFWLQDEDTKMAAGDRMYDLWYGRYDWDIYPVHTAARDALYNFEGKVTCGTGYGANPCANALTFNHKCYAATAINYSLWGRMNELEQESQDLYGWTPDNGLSNFSLDYAINFAKLWKWSYPGPANPVVMDQLGAFVRWGYTGSFMPPMLSPCQGSSCATTYKSFSYVWGDIHGTPLRGR